MAQEARSATWRTRLPVLALVIACVAGVVAAMTGAANPVAAVRFLLPGHWVYNAAFSSVFHVDGSTGNVDARVRMPGDAGDQVFQGDTSGYVVGRSRVTEFDKSSQRVEESRTPASRARPDGVETAGGPYLVYRQDGKVVRLGDPSVVLSLGGSVGAPVATADGTLWLPRTGAGLLCQLTADAMTVSCPVLLPEGHAGALTVVNERVVFVDTTADTLHLVEQDGLGEGQDLGVDAPDDARLASTDVEGRIAILDDDRMHLVDSAEVEPAAPVSVGLPEGDYEGPVSTGKVVALVDKKTDTLTTYASDGTPKETKALPAEEGDPRITRGEDNRVYVDDAEGEHVVVVDEDGGLTDVPIAGEPAEDELAPPRAGQDTDVPPATPPRQPRPDQPSATEQDPPPAQDPPARQPPVMREPPPMQTPPPMREPPQVPASRPGAPTGVSAAAGDATATVNWGPAPGNRSPIVRYVISWPGGQTTTPPGARTTTIRGLANGTSYVFTVTAVNGVGSGPGVSTNPVTPVAPVSPAAAPGNLAADYDVDDRPTRDVTVSWQQPDLGGGTLLHYLVTATDLTDRTVTETATMYEQLEADRAVTFTVRAITEAPDGRILTGAPASLTVADQP
jgi:hypothetical protein